MLTHYAASATSLPLPPPLPRPLSPFPHTQKHIMKLFSIILLLSCLANVAMGAVNLRAENSEELFRK